MKNMLNEVLRQTDFVLHEIFRGADFGEIVAKELHKNVYADAIKQTDILDGAKLPWNAKYPLIKRIGGYDNPIEKVAAAVRVATNTRDQIEGALKSLYQERDNRIVNTEHAQEQINVLEENLSTVRTEVNKQIKAKKKAKSEVDKGLDVLEQELKKKYAKTDGRKESIKTYSTPVQATTEMMATEDALQKQMVDTEALQTSVDMLDVIIRDYRILLNTFNKRAAHAKALSEILTKSD